MWPPTPKKVKENLGKKTRGKKPNRGQKAKKPPGEEGKNGKDPGGPLPRVWAPRGPFLAPPPFFGTPG